MYILPLVCDPIPGSSLQHIWLFLERNGSHLISLTPAEGQEPHAAAAEFLAANELNLAPGSQLLQEADIIYAPIDRSDPDLAAFYTWAETPPGSTPLKEAWRMVLWTTEAPEQDDAWGVNKLLDSIPVSSAGQAAPHTLYTVLKAYFKASRP